VVKGAHKYPSGGRRAGRKSVVPAAHATGGVADARARRGGPSLSDRAYQQIKDRIITLAFLPGQYLNEGAISEMLGLGRTPVHQALQQLRAEGMVEIVPRKGVIIQADSIGLILDILDARALIEGDLARRAAELATEREIKELETILEAQATRGRNSVDAFLALDRAFHFKVAAVSRNEVLRDIQKNLHERSSRSWYLHLWQSADAAEAGLQHSSVLNAIRDKNGAAASRGMRAHLEDLKLRFINIQKAAPRRVGSGGRFERYAIDAMPRRVAR
jgi:DNA-binding GntR family transcriptional regulator